MLGDNCVIWPVLNCVIWPLHIKPKFTVLYFMHIQVVWITVLLCIDENVSGGSLLFLFPILMHGHLGGMQDDDLFPNLLANTG